ncbi:type III secretion protein HrpB4 [Paraburkholderia megapolitana]|uniref:Type III secretion protein (HrpB4) n=1 Tax=Paraburkholderia megapolitana TaxID=420953 RepID=A0A1I3DTS5_9BURK|nr:type III secretion protein HrpB4 [Paraburkholderia megapolitana]QDQ79768.1 hypothetical protein FNZ07_00480 [Paraburkholderia megapolitana]SFH90095.1 type III secretion protein (HrpB4) [Paraburkholderia megapolitana]
MSDAQTIDDSVFADDFSAAIDAAEQFTQAASDAPQAADVADASDPSEASDPAPSEPAVDPAVKLSRTIAANLAEYHQRRRTLFEWMHPARIASFAYAACLPGLDARRGAQLAEAFLDSVGFTPAPLPAFGDASVALMRLPLADCLKVLRMRVLVEHVYELRLWIDRPRRVLLDEWLGPHLTRMLLAQRGGLTAGQPLRGEPSADSLALQGFRLFERDCRWSADHPMMLLQFALPDETAPARLPDTPGHAKVSKTSLTLVSQLADFFPTRSW